MVHTTAILICDAHVEYFKRFLPTKVQKYMHYNSINTLKQHLTNGKTPPSPTHTYHVTNNPKIVDYFHSLCHGSLQPAASTKRTLGTRLGKGGRIDHVSLRKKKPFHDSRVFNKNVISRKTRF